jgi:hypothetical protein
VSFRKEALTLGGKITDQQVRKLMEEMAKKSNKRFAAMKAGIDRRTAAKYLELGKLPSELPPIERSWRTRENPFEEHWQEVGSWLENAPELEAKFLFDHLCEKYPGTYQEGQLRTLQRHVRQWRAINGPDKEVFFSQEHYPGQLMQTDFTHMNSLGVSIRGEEFTHMLCHCVLTYSNWEWGRICFSESYEAIKLGVQSTLVKLGRVPERHRTDGTTAATHLLEKGKKGKRDFNEEYKNLMDHFAMKPETVNDPNHNADVESSHNVLKNRINQHLIFRGKRDFENRGEYEAFIFNIMEKANIFRSKRLKEELDVMKELPVSRLPLYTETEEKVRPSSTVRLKKNVYSVPSRLIGERVTARVYEDKIYILYAGKLQLEVERLRGSGGKYINYRHIIWSLVNKPGAFENYKYRQELFPTIHFRKTYDALRGWYSPFIANKEYLRILYYAATTMESEVETALILLLEGGAMFSSDHVKELVGGKKQTAPAITPPRVNLAEYNIFLKEAAS